MLQPVLRVSPRVTEAEKIAFLQEENACLKAEIEHLTGFRNKLIQRASRLSSEVSSLKSRINDLTETEMESTETCSGETLGRI
jgi:predicted nuclease with TOPRIM domain